MSKRSKIGVAVIVGGLLLLVATTPNMHKSRSLRIEFSWKQWVLCNGAIISIDHFPGGIDITRLKGWQWRIGPIALTREYPRSPTGSAHSVVYRDGLIIIAMQDGREIRFPVAKNPRLACGTPEQLHNVELSPFGVHWPDLDEKLSFRGLLAGEYGQDQSAEPEGAANRSQPGGAQTNRTSSAAGSGR